MKINITTMLKLVRVTSFLETFLKKKEKYVEILGGADNTFIMYV